MAWFVIVNRDTGDPVSFCDAIPDDLPPLLFEAVELPRHPQAGEVYDPATRKVTGNGKTLIDRVQDLADDVDLTAVWLRLTATQRTVLRTRLARLLGPARWRFPGEKADVGG